MSSDHQIEKLEEFATETRERLARLEASNLSIMLHMATKADLAQLETRMQRWFIGTAVALTGLAFAAGRFV